VESTNQLLTPQEIRAHLDEYVIGQDDAKKVLSVAVYNHYKRIRFAQAEGGVEIKKSNILMCGPTGSGKTYLATTLAKTLGVPIAMADATILVNAQSPGKEIDAIIIKLIQAADFNIQKAQQGIVFIDEIDKLVTGINRLKGESIQQALLKVIEGTVNNIDINGKIIPFDTNNVLFIVGGAFVALSTIIQIRLSDTKAGLLTESELIKDAQPEDFAKFGLIPEFCGRLPVIVALNALGREELIDAVLKPKNNISSQYVKMFAMDNIELVFQQSALERVAEMAISLKTGARGLRTILEKAMREIMYTVPNKKNINKITITPEVIEGKGEAIYEYIESVGETEIAPCPAKEPRRRE
jgi:ATP-dependent Clp protease ATP-binding subunit ClpX